MSKHQAIARDKWRVLAGALLVVGALVTLSAARTPRELRLYFVAIGEVPRGLLDDFVTHFQARFGVPIAVLSPLSFDSVTFDRSRSQIVAEELILAVRRRYATLVRDSRVRVIGVTPFDMYMEAMRDKWTFTFSLRSNDRHVAVVSYARMDPVNLGAPPNDELLRSRLRKMLTKNMGIMYYELPSSPNPKSALYRDILGVDDLDRMSEDFSPR